MPKSKLLSTLRPAGLWLIVWMCLALVQPLLSMASPAPQGTSRQLEFTAPDFDVELLNSPVEHPGSAKHSLHCPETESVSSRSVPIGRLLSGRPDYPRITITSQWLTKCHPLFFPRPPPHS